MGHEGVFYTTEIEKHYKSELSFFLRELIFQHIIDSTLLFPSVWNKQPFIQQFVIMVPSLCKTLNLGIALWNRCIPFSWKEYLSQIVLVSGNFWFMVWFLEQEMCTVKHFARLQRYFIVFATWIWNLKM